MLRVVASVLVCLAIAQSVQGLAFRNSLTAGAAAKFNPTFFQTATPRNSWVLLTRAVVSPIQNPIAFIGNDLNDEFLDVQRVVAVGPDVEDLREGDLVYADGEECENLPIHLNQRINGASSTNIAGYCFLLQSDIHALAFFGAYSGNRGSLGYSQRFTTIPRVFGVPSTGRSLSQESSFNSRILVGPGKAHDFYVNAPTFGTDLRVTGRGNLRF